MVVEAENHKNNNPTLCNSNEKKRKVVDISVLAKTSTNPWRLCFKNIQKKKKKPSIIVSNWNRSILLWKSSALRRPASDVRCSIS
jgi:hypothetical protein